MQSFALPCKSVKKNILAVQAQFKGEFSLCSVRPDVPLYSSPPFSWFFFFNWCFLIERDPGNVETLTDLLLEKWKNFPEAHQLGEESARFIRSELEATWGQIHLSVLSEDEAQKWLLGVSICFYETKMKF